MIVTLTDYTCTAQAEPGDPKFYASRSSWGSAESRLLYHIKRALLAQGHDVIKKRMWRDGHLVSDEQQYIRTRVVGREPSFYVWDHRYQVRSSAEDFNHNNRVVLRAMHGIWDEPGDHTFVPADVGPR